MDLGVGSFVFSSGLVSSRQKETSILKQIWVSFRSSATILFLGVLRTILTKNLEYQVYAMLNKLILGTYY
jgi:glucosaminylphosphatidylinositol acyltransferase